jgi:UDP-N-acetylmuramoylalanine--D-glutamate ligase
MDPGEAWAIPEEPLLIAASAGKGGRGLWLGKKPGVWLEDGHVGLSEVPDPGEVPFAGFALPGIHNRENLAAALFLANLAGVRRDQVQLSCLTGLAHRMETVATINGMTWINDSKATNVDATLIALAALTTEGQLPAVVLLGGQGKAGSPYELLVNPLKAAVKIICFGASGPEIAAALSCLQPELVPTMAEAVARAAVCSARYVLLTPACASFDEFRNFEHRGECFTAQVHALESSIYGS